MNIIIPFDFYGRCQYRKRQINLQPPKLQIPISDRNKKSIIRIGWILSLKWSRLVSLCKKVIYHQRLSQTEVGLAPNWVSYFVSNWTPFVIWDLSDDLLSFFESSLSYLMIKVIVLFSCPLTHSTWLQLSIRINQDWPSQTIAMGKNAPWANSFERNCIVQQIWRF